MGVSGKAQEWAFIEPFECKLGEHMLTHSFLYVPECPIPQLGRDLLHKLGATTHLMGDKLESGVPLDKGHKMIMLMAEDTPPRTEQVDLSRVNPEVWAQGWVEQTVGASPMIVHLKPGHTWPSRKQYSPSGGLVAHSPCYTGPN